MGELPSEKISCDTRLDEGTFNLMAK